MDDYYSLLDVPRTATLHEIKTSYKKLLLKYHPDKQDTVNGSEAKIFLNIQAAWNTLSNFHSRKAYNQTLADRESFECLPIDREIVLQELRFDKNSEMYKTMCRCGGEYSLPKQQLGADVHVLYCESCSLCIRVFEP